MRQGCLIRIRTISSGNTTSRQFMLQAVMEVETNSSDGRQLELILPLRASEFFSCRPDEVSISFPSRRSTYKVLTEMQAVLSGDPSEFSDASGLLEEYLGSTGWVIKVLQLTTTCGSGYTLEEVATARVPDDVTNSSENSMAKGCMPCQSGKYKLLLDNSPCVTCPAHSSTNSTGAIAASQCRCLSQNTP